MSVNIENGVKQLFQGEETLEEFRKLEHNALFCCSCNYLAKNKQCLARHNASSKHIKKSNENWNDLRKYKHYTGVGGFECHSCNVYSYDINAFRVHIYTFEHEWEEYKREQEEENNDDYAGFIPPECLEFY